MRLLAIDTALAACSAAIYDTDIGVIAMQSSAMARGHAEALMPMVAQVIAEAKTGFADIDRIVVTTGPGSFTGLRVGVAAARGLALAAKKPAVGVTTLAAFAAPHILPDDKMPILSVIDARNDNVYMEVFGAAGVSLQPARLAPLKDAVQAVAPGPVLIVGSAAQLVASAWPDWMLPSWVKQHPAPDIEWIARLGADAELTGTPPKPFYLHEPHVKPPGDAQIAKQ